MGAGILPISFNGVCMVFLLGKEHNNEWSDFGGTSLYKHETKFKTAIREGHEELSGILGSPKELKYQVKNNYIAPYSSGRYTTFMFNTDYDKNLPIYFNRNYRFVKNNTPHIIDNNYKGLYEKKEIAWFTSEEIYSLKLRPFYKDIIYFIINNNQ